MKNMEIAYSDWLKNEKNVGDKTIQLYVHVLGIIGEFLNNKKGINRYNKNFFQYTSNTLFRKVYQEILNEEDEKVIEIVKGKTISYNSDQNELFNEFMVFEKQYYPSEIKYENFKFGSVLRNYLKFLYEYNEEDIEEDIQQNEILTNTKILNTENLYINPELPHPVMYYVHYVTGENLHYDDNTYKKYRFIKGLKYVDNLQYISMEDKEKYCGFLEEFGNVPGYSKCIFHLIDKEYKGKIILASIPSSKKDKISVVNKIVDYVCSKDNRFINGNHYIKKLKNTETAHEKSGKRDWKTQIESLEIDTDILKYKNYPILVIDDVMTSGSSFTAIYKLLQAVNYGKDNIYFYSFGSTIKNENYINLNKNKVEEKTHQDVKGIIFDLDQTLFNSNVLFDYDFKKQNDKDFVNDLIYQQQIYLYEKIEELMYFIQCQSNVKVAFVTNRGNGAKYMLNHFKKDLYIEEQPGHNFLLYFKDCVVQENGKDYYKKKPDAYLINKAIEKMKLNVDIDRVVGVGNTLNDISAYNNALIESILVDWGNHQNIENDLGANHIFHEVRELKEFIMNNIEK